MRKVLFNSTENFRTGKINSVYNGFLIFHIKFKVECDAPVYYQNKQEGRELGEKSCNYGVAASSFLKEFLLVPFTLIFVW